MTDSASDSFAQLRVEIQQLRSRHQALVRERPETVELATHWTFAAGVLRWHVAVEDVDEPDIDIEVLADLIVVRAQRHARRRELLLGLLPVPAEFARARALFRYENGYLEISLASRGGEAGRR
ncbi:MAG: hypothetical protein ACKVX7_15560 [Planctomycetota bacterium]